MNTDHNVDPRSIIKKNDGFFAYYFSAQVANLIVRAFAKLPITPNMYTWASLILGFVAAWYFSLGEASSLVVGVILLNISFIFDCCDGQCSRLKGLQSKMGHWFDYHSDKLKDGALLAGLAYGVFVTQGETYWWIFLVAFTAIFFQFLRNITALTRDNFKLEHEGKKDEAHTLVKERGDSQLMVTLKNSSLFKLSDRVLLMTVFVTFGYVVEYIVLYAALEVFYAFSSAYINYKLFNKFDKRSFQDN